MKTIKKVAIAVAIAVAASAATFAVDYSGDLQLQFGWQGAGTKLTRKTDKVDIDFEFPNNAFYLGLSNWNLWNMNTWFSVGFYDKLDLSVGEFDVSVGDGTATVSLFKKGDAKVSSSFVIGPAFGFRIKNIIRFQLGMGFGAGSGIIAKNNDWDKMKWEVGVVGFELDLQAKFAPHSVISPLIGFQYAKLHMNEYDIDVDKESRTASVARNDSFNLKSYTLYAGLSVNFGKR